MLSGEIRDQIRDILDLLAQLNRTPILIYQNDDNSEVVKVAGADEKYFPDFCHAMWRVGGGAGRRACEDNMCGRMRWVFGNLQPQTHVCHAGLTNEAHPITIDGEPLAAMQYGAYISEDTDREARRQQLQNTLQKLKATPDEIRELNELFDRPELLRIEEKVSTLRQTLPEIVTKLLTTHLLKQQSDLHAFHDLQMRLQSAQALAESLQRDVKALAETRQVDAKMLESKAGHVVGAIQAMGTTMHSLTRGQYLPRKYTFEPKNILHYIDKALLLVRAQAARKNLDIRVDFSPRPGYTIWASEIHLQEAFNNLVQNAVKYSYSTPRGAPDSKRRYILIKGKVVDELSKVWIENYGIGIERDEYKDIFKGGYRGRLTRSEVRVGSGQGLRLTQHIIEAHQGTVSVFSEPAAGLTDEEKIPYKTTFTVTLPLKPWHK
jgi:signal transduction histidine kinase